MVRPFESFDAATRDLVTTEAEDIGRFSGFPASLAWHWLTAQQVKYFRYCLRKLYRVSMEHSAAEQEKITGRHTGTAISSWASCWLGIFMSVLDGIVVSIALPTMTSLFPRGPGVFAVDYHCLPAHDHQPAAHLRQGLRFHGPGADVHRRHRPLHASARWPAASAPA